MAEKQETLVRRMIDEVWNKRNVAHLDRFLTTDYVNHDPVNPTVGLDAYRGVVEKYLNAFPDCRIDIDETLSDGDTVVIRWRYSGTQRGQLEGLSPTGRRATGTGISICRCSGDRIREAFVNWDALGLMQQLGVVTLPGKSAAAGA